jgi:hypothetical protein
MRSFAVKKMPPQLSDKSALEIFQRWRKILMGVEQKMYQRRRCGDCWEFRRLPSYMNRQQNVGAIYYAQSAQKSSATPI